MSKGVEKIRRGVAENARSFYLQKSNISMGGGIQQKEWPNIYNDNPA